MNQYSSLETVKKFQNFKNIFEKKQYKLIETPSVLKLVGDLTNKTIIDYGCGSGHYSRKLAKLAKHVVGVDLSPHMIELAKQINENENITNIDYYAHDCSEILNLGEFDIVFSACFLNHAQNPEQLKKFFKSMYSSCKQKCYGIIPNPFLKPEDFHYLRKYGHECLRDGNAKDGDTQIQRFYEAAVGTSECLYEVNFHYYSHSLFQSAAENAGFVNFWWIKFKLSDEYKHLENYFSDYLIHPSTIMFSIEKP